MKPTGSDREPAFGRLVARGLAREADASGNACPDADLLAAWYDHTLSAVESERVEAHAAGCECCQQILAALARSEPEVIRAAPLPAPAHAWHWHWRWAVPLATAVLVVVVGTRTLRAPGPAAPPVAPVDRGTLVSILASPEKSPAVSGTGANVPASRMAEKQAPSRLPGKSNASARLAAAPALSAPPSPPPRARAEAAPNAAPVLAPPQAAAPAGAVAASQPESRVADAARRQADAASQKLTTPTTATAVGGLQPIAESVAVAGAAPRKEMNLAGLRPPSVVASAAAGSNVSWRFGIDGAIERSSDRGQTWERLASGVTTSLNAASAPGDLVCWIVGARGVVLRTVDGRTWQLANSPTGVDLMSVYAASDLAASVTARDRTVYETADGGRTWTRRR